MNEFPRRMIIQRKLAAKMSLYILTGVFSVFLFIIIYNYQVSRKIILRETESNAYNLSQSILYQVENMLLPAQKIPENLSCIMENSIYDKPQLENFLRMIVKNNKDVFGSCIAFEPYAFMKDIENYAPYAYYSGDSVIMNDLGSGNYNYRNWSWYLDPQENGPCWGEPYYDEGGGNVLMATYSVPFYEKTHEHAFRGVTTVDISLDKLRRMIGQIKVFNTGYSFLISHEGVFIYHPDSLVVAKETVFSFARKNNLTDFEKIGKDMVAGKTGFMQYYSLLLHEDCYLFHTSLKSNGWSLAMVIPEKEILADLYSLNRRILLIGISGFVAIFIIIILISGSITTPLVKLAEATRRVGAGEFDVKLPEYHSGNEIGQLNSSFAAMQEQLREYIHDLKEVTAAREKIESELKIAHDIQQGIIPKIFPPFPQRSDVDIHAALIPAREVGGDMYDYFFIDDDILAFSIGDVSGKGVPASLLMAITRTLFRSRAQKQLSVNEIADAMNADLCLDNENAMFVTFFLGLIDVKTKEISYCNAGHNYPIILHRNGGTTVLNQTHGIPLGLYPEKKYESGSVVIGTGDCLVLYTDGVTEAMDMNGNLFGEERLTKMLAAKEHGFVVSRVTQNILESIEGFAKGAEQADDITILVMSFR